MDEFERDAILKRFTDLTGLFEDAAGLAVDGQSSRRSLTSVHEIIARIRPLLIASMSELAAIERDLRHPGTD